MKLRRDPQCPVCGENPTIVAPIDYDQFCGAGEDESVPSISVQELKGKMDARDAFELIDVREPFEFEIARIDGAKLIPLGEISGRADELHREQTSSSIVTADGVVHRPCNYLSNVASLTSTISKAESMHGRISSTRGSQNTEKPLPSTPQPNHRAEAMGLIDFLWPERVRPRWERCAIARSILQFFQIRTRRNLLLLRADPTAKRLFRQNR